MNPTRVFAALILTALATVTSGAFQTPRAWPPDVQRVPDESPVLTPAQELKTIYMPPGYHLELVASEPMVQDPWSSTGTPRVGC